MARGFYDLLGVEPAATPDRIREAYQRRLAELVRRLRVARQQGADVSLLESQERAVREAMEVLSDAARRRRYDAYLAVSDAGPLPEDAEQLWEAARGGMVDPVAGAALSAVRALTRLPVGHPLPAPPPGYSQRQGWAVDLRKTDPPPAAEPVTSHDDIEIEPAAPEHEHSDVAAESQGTIGVPGATALTPPPPRPAMPEVDRELTVTDPRLPFDPPIPTPQHDIGAAPDTAAPAPARRGGLFGKLAAFASGDRGPAELPLWDDAPGPSPGPSPMMAAPVWEDDPTPPPALPTDPIARLRMQHGDGGAMLAAVREHRGLTLDGLARTTRISARYLTALEADAFDKLPSATFVRGYVRQVVQALELDDTGVVDAYMALYTSHRG